MSLQNIREDTGNISTAQMKYLYKIYQISLTKPEVLSADIARKLKVTKPSVVKMLSVLSEKNLIFKKRYGKISITDAGIQVAHDYECRIKKMMSLIPKMGLPLSEQEVLDSAFVLADTLPEKVWEPVE